MNQNCYSVALAVNAIKSFLDSSNIVDSKQIFCCKFPQLLAKSDNIRLSCHKYKRVPFFLNMM